MSRRTKNLRAFVRGVSVLALALCALSSMACQSDSSRKEAPLREAVRSIQRVVSKRERLPQISR